jgi:hypothetical protein
MAVVSAYTTQSWWVPFETGVASGLERRIVTYQLNSVDLPEFLTKWPLLRSTEDLGRFIRMYRLDAATPLSEGRTAPGVVQDAPQFHRALKTLLGQ